MRIIGLDVGRHRVKVYSDGCKLSFPSYCGSYRALRLERTMTEDDLIVEWKGCRYYVGAIARDEADDGVQNFLTSKVTTDTQLIGLTALYRAVENGEEISLVVGHPIINHTQPEKEGMRQLFTGEHELTVNGVYKRFKIRNFTIVPEGASTQFILPSKLVIAHGIDAGGATTNYCTWERGRWVDRLSGTLQFGLENMRLSIDQFARLVANNVAQKIHQFRGPIYVMGGAAEPLSSALRQYIRNVPIEPLEDGMYANARSYYEIGVKLYEKVQTQR
jgi:plasmid segregation protein ParM